MVKRKKPDAKAIFEDDAIDEHKNKCQPEDILEELGEQVCFNVQFHDSRALVCALETMDQVLVDVRFEVVPKGKSPFKKKDKDEDNTVEKMQLMLSSLIFQRLELVLRL